MDHSLPQDNPLRNYLAILQKEIFSLEIIITQLEEFASLPQPEYKKEDLVDVIQTLIDEAQTLGYEKGVHPHLKISLPSQERTLYLDRTLILKALEALMNATLEMAHQDAQLTLHLHSNADYYMIDIRSSGSSLLATDMKTIFETFFTSKFQVGKIRLALARRIIEDQGGKLEALSSPEEGAFFRVSLLRERRRKIRRQLV
jgi:K+-sensing histidine kinase KdpD